MKYINDFKASRVLIKAEDGFGGIVPEGGGGENAVFRAENISDDLFPSLSPRRERGYLCRHGKITAAYADENFVRIENGGFYKGDTKISEEYFSEGFRHGILRLGGYYLVMPDGVYFNATDNGDFGAIEQIFTKAGVNGTPVATVDGNFNVITEYTVSRNRPTAAEEGQLWAEPQENGGYHMKRYDGHAWRDYESYVRLTSDSVVGKFKVGDILECKGAQNVLGTHIKLSRLSGEYAYFYGAAPHIGSITDYSVRRPLPLMEYVTVSGGRAVGAFCGYDGDGKFVSRAYASAVNNPLSWSEYDGALSVEIPGHEPITAIAEYCGDTVLFRESSIVRLKITGGKMTVTSVAADGIGIGKNGGAVTVDGKLYYKGRRGVYAYDGSRSMKISAPLGETLSCGVENAPAGEYNGKYYIRLSDKNGKSGIYVYNPKTKIWTVENDPGVKDFIKRGESLIAICEDTEGDFLVLWDYRNASADTVSLFSGEAGAVPEGRVSWFFETGEIAPDIKKGYYPARVLLKVKLLDGGTVAAGCTYRGQSVPERIVNISERRGGYFEIPLLVMKNEPIRLYAFGRGASEIMGYAVEYRLDNG